MSRLVPACEAILEQPKAPSFYICTGTQGISPLPVVRVEGLPDPLSWPVLSAQHEQLSAEYGKASVVPATDLLIANQRAFEEALLQTVVHKLLSTLGIRASNVGVVLSHLCIDAVGSTDVLRAAPSCIANAFGTLIVLLPSFHTGGVLTFRRQTHAITLPHDAAERPRGFDGVFINTTIESTPVTSGRRLALVFDLTGVHETERGPSRLPLNRTGLAAKLTLLAAQPLPQCQRIACSLTYLRPAPGDFGHPHADEDSLFLRLRPRHRYLVNIRLASAVFDIAVVRFSTRLLTTRNGSSNDERVIDNHVAAFEVHSSCDVPDLVAHQLVGVAAHAFLGDPDHDELAPVSAPSEMALLFWPKRFRAGIVGMKPSLALLRHAVLNRRTARPLGLTSVRELVLGTMAFFHSVASLDLCDERTGNARDGSAAAMGDVLCALNDKEIAAYFLSDALAVSPGGTRCSIALPDAAACVQSCLMAFGRRQLATAICDLLRRWLTSTTQRAHVVGLVSLLAGLSQDANVAKSDKLSLFALLRSVGTVLEELWPRSQDDAGLRCVLMALAAKCRDAYVAGGLLLPVPGMRDGDLVDIPFAPKHCGDCSQVRHFLDDGTQLRHVFRRRVCARVRDVAVAHPRRLRFKEKALADGVYKASLRKVQQPGRMRIAHAALAKRRHVSATTSYRHLEAFRGPTPGNTRQYTLVLHRPVTRLHIAIRGHMSATTSDRHIEAFCAPTPGNMRQYTIVLDRPVTRLHIAIRFL
ncbi:hypothetical protein SDRG_15075 [Saprolegnia diclina VS20]|uniref:Uncharacterized protein n=1 Tax=Saprolegnia diclina (strain VS20) TaxID=1156394 RepID=T0Q127_SAPDV|nr:hypothetical protein SDRG_15075 [Saprolegnia diclina VS20]EQC27065.1 hypothetical protein SDRG_15075 [Saprolegnia diclina VS20]|eukprot:XP_008619459.1 hypothetical protein SDRG_15075 [Saprolegnia diclina VS20]